MKIAVTADVHLTTHEDNPERLNALANIFDSLADLEINQLIIAGDLFNKDISNYSEFEKLCGQHDKVTVHLIAGNHDPSVEANRFTTGNVRVYGEPTRVDLDGTFLFVPYQLGTSMGKAIATEVEKLEPGKWILVGHGNYCRGIRQAGPDEQGTYMPLFRSDIDRYKPRTVLLGHIHIRSSTGIVHYPGSPCGLDITEVGRRNFLVYDTENADISPHPVNTDALFFQESFMIVPRDDELSRLKQEIEQRIGSWGLDESGLGRVQLRIRARGFCNDKQAIADLLRESFRDFSHYKDADPDVSKLSVNNNNELGFIAKRVEEEIANMDWGSCPAEARTDPDEIMGQALQVIYGGGDS
ncbi:MAG: metallophosphoesterase [Verrucomicrobiales bacterium]